MSAVVVRVLLVIAAVVLVAMVARLVGRWQRPSHPVVDVTRLQPDGGIVVFTSTDCATCAEARSVVEGVGVVMREVTWELEPARFAAAGVEAVPLTVVVAEGGAAVSVFAGVPRRRALRRAVAKAGIAAPT